MKKRRTTSEHISKNEVSTRPLKRPNHISSAEFHIGFKNRRSSSRKQKITLAKRHLSFHRFRKTYAKKRQKNSQKETKNEYCRNPNNDNPDDNDVGDDENKINTVNSTTKKRNESTDLNVDESLHTYENNFIINSNIDSENDSDSPINTDDLAKALSSCDDNESTEDEDIVPPECLKKDGKSEYVIRLSDEEFKRISPEENCLDNRSLKKGWTDLMADKFKEHNPVCVLVFTRNTIKRKDSRKKKSPYFNGKAKCTFPKCATYDFFIKEEPRDGENVEVIIQKIVNITHVPAKKKRKLQGERRKNTQIKLLQEGVSNFFYTKMNEIDAESLKFGNETVCQSKTVLQKAVSEARINTYLHEDTFKELILVRDILAAEDIDNNKIQGYIQHISYDPFQIAMFEETQMKILAHKIKTGNCVLYFDATGTVVEKSGSPAKTVLYYALICKSDLQGDPPIPLAELITSDNTTPSITTFLHKVKYCLVKHFYERSGPQRIETDFSWALIHACLLVFNTEDVTRYISRSWNIVHHKCSTAIIKHFTIMHICASHMIKAAKRQVESKIIDPAHVDFIVRIFALLQNERDFARLTEIWTSFCTVFAGKYLTETVKNSLETLNEMINTIGIEDYIDDTSYEEKNTAELELCESVIMMDKDIQIEIGQQEDPLLFISIVLNRLERTLIFDPLITITKLECLRCRKTKCLQEEHSIFAMDIPTSNLTTSVIGCINETLKDEALTDNDAVMLNIPCQYPNEYQLISILCHTGQNIRSGHYWAVEPSTNAVIVYDNSNVNVKLPSYINGKEIQSNAYLLAYERKDASLESGFLRGKIYLQQSDVDILKGTEWINDQLVNAYLSLLSMKYDNIAVVDSFWKEKPAFNDEWLLKEIVFFPYYTPCHWSILMVDNAEKEIALLDPAFSTTDFSFMKTVRKMWQQKGIELKRSRGVEQAIPKQQNSHDCGPFVLLFAKMICCRQHKEIINPRKEILEDILRGYL